jgi:hypothetical protein
VKRWKVEIGYSDEEAGAAEADPRMADLLDVPRR